MYEMVDRWHRRKGSNKKCEVNYHFSEGALPSLARAPLPDAGWMRARKASDQDDSPPDD